MSTLHHHSSLAPDVPSRDGEPLDAARLLDGLRTELHAELVDHILPYWMRYAVDEARGGFVGHVDAHNLPDADAPRGAVLNARILWTFSAAYHRFGTPVYREMADRAAAYVMGPFMDREYGGVYWSIHPDGTPHEARKHVYAQSFAIYGLVEHFRATRNAASLEAAVDLFHLVERHAADPLHGGYDEAFARDWTLLDDLRLSEVDDAERRSMNSHLHILEAYTHLYRVYPDALLKERLLHVLDLLAGYVVNPATGHLWCFLDETWHPRSDVISFGHDIEASWLLLEAADVLGDPDVRAHTRALILRMAAVTLEEGRDADGGLYEEAWPDGRLSTDKEWWPQAEAIVGFLNAYQETQEPRFLEAAVSSWSFVKRFLVDRTGGEWYRRVNREGVPYPEHEKVGEWKCPYHNGRACLEGMERTERLLAVAT